MKTDLVRQFYQLTQNFGTKQERFDLRTLLSKNFSYILFLSFLTLVYITNAHIVERKIRKIKRESVSLQKLKWQYFTLQANVLEDGIMSNVSQNVENIGLETISRKPEKLIVTTDGF